MQGRQGSNLQLAVLETAALPVELLPFDVVMLKHFRAPNPTLRNI